MSMEFGDWKTVWKTRKDHGCEHCNLTIPEGSTCIKAAGKYDGDFFSYYCHNEYEEKYKEINFDSGHDDWVPLYEIQEVEPDVTITDWRRGIAKKYNLYERLKMQIESDLEDDQTFRRVLCEAIPLIVDPSDFANSVSASRTTVNHWRLGTSVPHLLVRKIIKKQLLERIEEVS